MKSNEITREKLNEMSRDELVEAILLQQEKNAQLSEKQQEMERKLYRLDLSLSVKSLFHPVPDPVVDGHILIF